jgi:hypothetical protein
MAKSSRASTKKANSARLKAAVFSPVETARTERLSAKLLELASQPKPRKEDTVADAEGMNTYLSIWVSRFNPLTRYYGGEQRLSSIKAEASGR